MRYLSDDYELPDDDDDDYSGEYVGALFRKRRRRVWPWVFALVFLALGVGGVYSIVRVNKEQQTDTFCTGCHTVPEATYVDRSTSSIAGALAPDLASFHYQQVSGAGGTLRCIDCHQGNGGIAHRFDLFTLSVRNAVVWLSAKNDPRTEKGFVRAPQLSNDSCLHCHQKTLLLAGMDNHFHNMLPAAYEIWRSGGSLIAPANSKDVQAIIATGLVKYNTSVLCSDCHQSHRSLETDQYLDKDQVLPLKCVQCHRDVNKGPLQVTVQ